MDQNHNQTEHAPHHPKPTLKGVFVIGFLIILSICSQFVFDTDDDTAKNVNGKKSHKTTVKKPQSDTIIMINHLGFKDTFIKEGNKVYDHGMLINSKIRYEK